MKIEKLHEIQRSIGEMFTADQTMRTSYERKSSPWDDAMDKKHTSQVKEILAYFGKWPSLQELGEDTCTQLWVLVQHADHDLAWQKSCLEMMRRLDAGEVTLWCIAFLTDRVCMNEGQPQIYGSQMQKGKSGGWAPYDLLNPESVNDRRARVGLEPIEDYIQGF